LNIQHHISKLKDLVPGAMTASEQAYVLSVLELVLHSLSEQSALIQSLKDEINILKGEQGKPDIAANVVKDKPVDENDDGSSPSDDSADSSDSASSSGSDSISSEQERKTAKGKRRKKRKKRIVKFDDSRRIDKEVLVELDKKGLPDDLEFKGFATSHYQDLEIQTYLIALKRKVYYSRSEGRSYTADYPVGYEAGSDYTQTLKGHMGMFKYELGVTNSKIGDFLRMNGVDITNPTVSNIHLKLGDQLKEERQAIHRSGIETGLYTQTDSTGARVNGQNQHSHIFCNTLFTSYFTHPNKDRQTVVDLLRCGSPREYLFNEHTFELYSYLKVPKKVQKILRTLIQPIGQPLLDQSTLVTRIEALLTQEDCQRHQDKILEGAYLSAYHQQNQVFPIHILLSDDAPQYRLISPLLSLCWVHIGRHFKKLNPTIQHHKNLLADFLTEFWQYYHQLKDYKKAPDIETAKKLAQRFDQIFSKKTGYIELDDRIDKTKAKRKQLLVVLRHPYLPLHNNEAELAARKEVRYRDISFQTKNHRGTQAKDVFFTIIQTCKKLGVNAYAYILDRLNHKSMSNLSELIYQKAAIT